MNVSRNKRLVLAAVTAVALPATLLAMQPTDASSAARSFRLVERDGTFHFVDLAPKQESRRSPATPGDELIFTSKLHRHGHRAGTLHAVCTVTKRASVEGKLPSVCNGSFVLRGGRLDVQTGGRLGGVVEISITGGTGRFAGASGTITSRQMRGKSVDIVRLMP